MCQNRQHKSLLTANGKDLLKHVPSLCHVKNGWIQVDVLTNYTSKKMNVSLEQVFVLLFFLCLYIFCWIVTLLRQWKL